SSPGWPPHWAPWAAHWDRTSTTMPQSGRRPTAVANTSGGSWRAGSTMADRAQRSPPGRRPGFLLARRGYHRRERCHTEGAIMSHADRQPLFPGKGEDDVRATGPAAGAHWD